MGIELKGLLIATSTYFNIPPSLSVDLGLLNLALFIAKELEK